MKMPRPILLFFSLLFVATATAQNSRTNAPSLVFRDSVEPHWFAGADGQTNKFWYRVTTGRNSHEFILVDAREGKRSSAFNHARLAEALVKVTKRPVKPEDLPIDSLDFARDGKSVVLHGDGSSWKLDLANYSLTLSANDVSDENQLPNIRTLHPSSSGGLATKVVFVNKLKADADLFWIDPDGKRVSYGSVPANGRLEISTYAGHVWLAASRTGEMLAVFEAAAKPSVAAIDGRETTAPVRRGGRRRPSVGGDTSPDGKWSVSVRGDNLFLRNLNVRSNSDFQLTYDANPNSTYARNAEADRAVEMTYDARDPETPTPEIYWAPDSKHFVAMRLQPGTHRNVYLVESSPEDQLQPKLDSYPYLKPGDQVPIRKPPLFDIELKKEIQTSESLYSNPWSISDVRWSTNSTRFTFLYNQRGHQIMRVVAVEAQTGAARAIIDEHSDTFIDYSGKSFSEYLDGTGEIIWASERDGWNHLYLYDAVEGRVKSQITKGNWLVRSVDFVDRTNRQIWFQAGGIRPEQDPYYVQFCRVNFDGSGLTVLTDGDGNHEAQFSPDRRYLIDTWSRVDQPQTTVLRSASDGKLLCKLEEADAVELYASGWKTPERFVAKGRDGSTDIFGVIWRPKDFEPNKKYPVIEDIYAGPQGFFTPKGFRASYQQQKLADHGFIVVQMDGMGTSGRSKKFHDVCWKNIRDAGFEDRILWIKAAAAKHPFMDISRVGIYGTSAGGQNALRAMLDHGDFYKVCVSDSGCHDNRMDKIWWNEQWMGWPVDDSYERSSNVTDAHKLQGKLLLMVGEMDKNVDPSSTMQVVNALIKADKNFDLLYMPGAGHGVARTPYGSRRLEEFFVNNFPAMGTSSSAGNSTAATSP
ncbi:MAG TPA: prolyl oligopeptidase family serine peptidase [Verrucomicrobiae bacterium]|jgi:dipeptidyl aminopeptidase/acylaminoacyl peptidase